MSLELVNRAVDADGLVSKPITVTLADGVQRELRFTAGALMDLLSIHSVDLHGVANKPQLLDGVIRRWLVPIIQCASRSADDEAVEVTPKMIRTLDHTQMGPLVEAIAMRLRDDFSRMGHTVKAQQDPDADPKAPAPSV